MFMYVYVVYVCLWLTYVATYKECIIFLYSTKMKEVVDGIIMVVSCQKHIDTRLKEFKLNRDQYDNWKVVYIIGDLFLNKEYDMRDGNYLWIRCEDSYLHIMKKVVLAAKYLYELFDIKEGILRCGDDLIFNDANLLTFLRSPKYDYYGQHISFPNGISFVGDYKSVINDGFMYDYYYKHPEDFDNPQHNVKNLDISKYIRRPDVNGAFGVIFYISNLACKILINHMEEIGHNILHFDELTQSYPYTIEDRGIAFVLFLNQIAFTNNHHFYGDTHYSPSVICTHTNKYK